MYKKSADDLTEQIKQMNEEFKKKIDQEVQDRLTQAGIS